MDLMSRRMNRRVQLMNRPMNLTSRRMALMNRPWNRWISDAERS